MFWRATISGRLFALHAVSPHPLRLRRRHNLVLFMLFGLLAVSLFNVGYFLAVQKGSLTLTTIMLYTALAFIAIVAHFLFEEKLLVYKIIIICLTIGGLS